MRTKQEEHKVHMAMLSKSENAKDVGDYTVIKLGFAVSIAKTLINQEVTSVLEELEKKSTHYTSDGLVADGLDPWATSVSAIQTVKERYSA